MIVVTRVTDKSMFDIAYRIRMEVFVVEQGVPEEIEMDEYDTAAHHVIAFRGTEPVGCGRVVLRKDEAQLGRVAVVQKDRNKGVGRKICQEIIAIALEKGAKKLVLHSQIAAVGFYKQLGFAEIGERFVEAGIDHIKMVREG